MVTSIVVKVELGHVATIRDVPLPSGHTHEWMVFVKGADGMVIEHFVDKVVFWLHESYDPSECIVKSPPFQVRQSGYAGFNILIDIHFKNKSEPRSVRFHYDMFLHMENMPPVNHTRVEMLTFTNPSEDFKKKLIRAGGVVKAQEFQVQPKEKKSLKGIFRVPHDHNSLTSKDEPQPNDESKLNRPIKQKYDQDKSKTKSHRSEMKPSKHHGKHEEKRRNSVSEIERVKKKKKEEKATTLSQHMSSAESKPKEKVKLKIKMDDSVASSLFAREESIDIKRLKKKEPVVKKEDSQKTKEKRPEVKIKQEKNDIPPKSEKLFKRKKEEKRRKSPEEKPKPIEETKPKKRPRTVSSSSSDADVVPKRASVLPLQSSSDSEKEQIKKKKKREKPDRIKPKKEIRKEKKPLKKPEKKISPDRISNNYNAAASSDMDISQTPPRDHISISERKYQNHGAIFSKERKSKSKTGSSKSRVTPAGIKIRIKDFEKKESSQAPPKKDKERQRYRSITPPAKAVFPTSVKKPVKTPPQPIRKEIKVSTSSDSSDGSDDNEEPLPDKELFKSSASPFSVSSSASSSSPVGEIPQFSHDHDEVVSPPDHGLIASPGALSDESDDESAVFESPRHEENHPVLPVETNDDYKSTVVSEQDEASEKSPAIEPPSVQIVVGATEKFYPDLTEETFERLREIHTVLGTITDEAALKKIASIIQKSGNFDMDGGLMGFDLCSLDQKTIRKLNKHLKEIAG